MININNIPLPNPQSLTCAFMPQATGGWLQKMSAVWAGLDAAGMAAILGPTGASFTLATLDPRIGAVRGFSARMSGCAVTAMDGNVWALSLTCEEVL